MAAWSKASDEVGLLPFSLSSYLVISTSAAQAWTIPYQIENFWAYLVQKSASKEASQDLDLAATVDQVGVDRLHHEKWVWT